MLSVNGQGVRFCDGLSRRELLRVGALGAAGLGLPELFAGRAASAASVEGAPAGGGFGRAKRCIMLFMSGGAPQQDTFDLKPDAPAEIRGEFRPIASRTPGLRMCELLPKLARQSDKFAVVRSVSHPDNIHTSAGHKMLTGNLYPRPVTAEVNATQDDFPHLGSVVSRLRGTGASMPTFVALPKFLKNTTGEIWPGQGGGFLGKAFDPFRIEGDPNAGDFRVESLQLPAEVSSLRINNRKGLLENMDRHAEQLSKQGGQTGLDSYRRRALDLVTSPAVAKAFRMAAEPDKVRERYGRHTFGQGALLARRLVEHGVPLVSVYWSHRDPRDIDNQSWDTHKAHYRDLKSHLLPPLDDGFSALLEDLHDRGLLDETLVVWTSEFGRTPKVNGAAGRDHWGPCFSVVFAGAGVSGGLVYGASDRMAAFPADNPVGFADVAATILHSLGIRPDTELPDRLGRPIGICQGQPIRGIFG